MKNIYLLVEGLQLCLCLVRCQAGTDLRRHPGCPPMPAKSGCGCRWLSQWHATVRPENSFDVQIFALDWLECLLESNLPLCSRWNSDLLQCCSTSTGYVEVFRSLSSTVAPASEEWLADNEGDPQRDGHMPWG